MTDKNFTTRGNEPVEARIVAWVLGEASAFEAEELQRLCEEQPELAVFKRRIEAVHGLAEQAHDRKDDAKWKLSIKKRAAIEELIGAEDAIAEEAARDFRAGQSGRRALLAIAACLVMTLVVASVMSPVIFSRMKSKSESSPQSAIYQSFNYADEMEDSASRRDGDFSLHGNAMPALGEHKKLEERSRSRGGRSKESEGSLGAGYLEGSVVDNSDDAFAPAPKFNAPSRQNKKPSATSVSPSSTISGKDGLDLPAAGGLPADDEGIGGSFAGSANSNGVAPGGVDYRYASKSKGKKDAKEGTHFYHELAPAAPAESAPDKFRDVTTRTYDKNAEVPHAKELNKRLNNGNEAEFKLSEDEVRFETEALKSTTSLSITGTDRIVDQLEKDAIYSFAGDEMSGKGLSLEKREMLEKELAKQEVLVEELQQQVQDEEGKLKMDPKPRPIVTDEETVAAEEPYSTFSLNINDASFRVAQAALARGEMPDPAGIKVEQFYNAVDYGDPAPAAGQPVACNIEQSAHPVIPGRNLVRVALKTASEGRSQGQPLRLTLLIDQSGSMAREDRRAAMVEALDGLRGLLNENDQVNVIGFARTPRLLAEAVQGNEGRLGQLVNIEANEGGTNLEEAIKLGEQLAQRYKLDGAQNRMVLFTDGAANLGDAEPDSLAEKIKDLRQKGIAFDIAGIVADGLNDELLGEMARHGNGRYYVVGKGEKDRFAQQLAGAFRPAAENVKVQVHFNPERVGRYKLIGFEKDRLNKEDFRNDAVDAAEMAAEEAGVAIYQVETLPEGKGEIGEVSVRFRDVASGEMVERSWTIANEIATPALDQARPSMQLAALAMLTGEKLRGGPLSDAINFKDMGEVIAQVNQHFKGDPKAADMLQMIDQLK